MTILKKRLSISTTHIILLSFLIVIFIGSFLLWLPISHKSNVEVGYLDALFTATTSTCVTGLVTLVTADTWSIFGQIVILLLIQIGGLGVITVFAGILVILHKKISLKDSQLIQDSFNINDSGGIKRFVQKVIIGSLIIELIGALLYMIVFIPDFGVKGIWISIFTAISGFCNAGIDIIGSVSLMDYATNPLVNIITSMLIILGGLGFIVWWDVIRVLKDFKNKKFKCFKSLTLHSKIVLFVTFVLIINGGLLIFIFEYNNPNTIGNLNIFDKIQVSLFQSITTRTAGFASIGQENLTNTSSIICIILMFIGGSPVGTAGGIKTVTFIVLIASAISTIRNKNETVIFNRTLKKETTRKALAIFSMSFLIVIVSTILLSIAMKDVTLIDLLYETVSATATVGLSRNLTMSLNAFGKIIIIVTMYLGRVGPISLAVAFNIEKKVDNIIKYPVEDIRIG